MFGCIIRPGSSFGNTGPKMQLFLEHVKQWVDRFGIERIGGPFISKFNITWAAVLQIYLGTVGVAPTQRMKVCQNYIKSREEVVCWSVYLVVYYSSC